MSNPTDQMQVNTPVDIGQVQQVPLAATNIALSTSIATSGSSVSGIVLTNGYKSGAFGCTSTQNGQISVQRYLDQAATIKQGAAITASLTANTAQVANWTDGVAFQSLIVTVTNTGGSPATLSNTMLLLQAS